MSTEEILDKQFEGVIGFVSGTLGSFSRVEVLHGGRFLKPRTVAARGFNIIATTSVIHRVCKAGKIAPYCDIDGEYVLTQSIMTSIDIGLFRGWSFIDELEEEGKNVKELMQHKYMHSKLDMLFPGVQETYEQIWYNAKRNIGNIITHITILAECLVDLVYLMDEIAMGNRFAYTLLNGIGETLQQIPIQGDLVHLRNMIIEQIEKVSE